MPLCPAPLHLPLLLMEDQPALTFPCVTDENPFYTPSRQCHWLPFITFFSHTYSKIIVGWGERIEQSQRKLKSFRAERKSTHIQWQLQGCFQDWWMGASIYNLGRIPNQTFKLTKASQITAYKSPSWNRAQQASSSIPPIILYIPKMPLWKYLPDMLSTCLSLVGNIEA